MALRQSTAMGFSTPGSLGMMGREPVAQTTASYSASMAASAFLWTTGTPSFSRAVA